VYVDETYANDDSTKSWCRTNILVPLNLYSLAIYPEPTYFIWSSFLEILRTSTPPILNVIEDAANVGCEKNHLLSMQ
jgi:hypothetical protein